MTKPAQSSSNKMRSSFVFVRCTTDVAIKRRKIEYFGYMVRANVERRALLEGNVSGRRRRGRQKRTRASDVMKTRDGLWRMCAASAMPERLPIGDRQTPGKETTQELN